MAENDVSTMRRRLASVASHLIAPVRSTPSGGGSIRALGCSASTKGDRYHRIHGEAPTHEPVWRVVPYDENGKEFTDIIYEKAVGEAIAKIFRTSTV